MKCIKCRKDIPDGCLFCPCCGKKQSATKARYHKREHGSGTITQDKRYKKPWIAHAPASRYGSGRVYLGCFASRAEASAAIEDYIKNGRPQLYGATLGDIYTLWTAAHFKTVSDSAIALYTYMWKRFAEIADIPMRDIRTAHFQQIVNDATSRSACDTIKAMAVMMCRFAMENDIIAKNYAEFIKIPKFDKKEKKIFSREDIAVLWEHSADQKIQIILFMIYTGLRIGELLQLRKSDIHIDEGYLIGGEKTEAGRNRVVPLPPRIPELAGFLQSWIDAADGERLFPMSDRKFRNEYFYEPLIEIGLADGAMYASGYYKFSGEHYTPHSTRHTFASISAAAGMRQENLQKIIGHSDYSTTADVYIHQDIEILRNEMAKIAR